jgi:hypothetical protein
MTALSTRKKVDLHPGKLPMLSRTGLGKKAIELLFWNKVIADGCQPPRKVTPTVRLSTLLNKYIAGNDKIENKFEKMASVAKQPAGPIIESKKEMCFLCQKTVYAMDKVTADDKVYQN